MISPQDGADLEHVVDGWHQEWEVHDDGDVRKLWHEAVHEDGRRVVLDVSPYQYVSREMFTMHVKLGFPRRSGPGPLSPEEVERLWAEAVGRIDQE
jgi:hypothetical protein